MKGASPVTVALVVIAAGCAAFFGHSWWQTRQWIVNRAFDDGACASTRKVVLTPPTPMGSRELFLADDACRRRVVAMLRSAAQFTCRGAGGLISCHHPLNAGDNPTEVRAVISPTHILLVTIPT